MRSSGISVILLFALLIWCFQQREVLGGAYVKFTNIECKTLDKSFSDFRFCRLKVLRRGVIGLRLHVELYQLPVTNVSLNMSLWKKASGYRPFMYNITVNFCEAMANRLRFPLLNILLNVLTKDSNINHTCPYNHDIIVSNLVLKDDMLARFPLPSDDYMLQLKVGAYNRWRADVKTYFLRMEDF